MCGVVARTNSDGGLLAISQGSRTDFRASGDILAYITLHYSTTLHCITLQCICASTVLYVE